MANLYRVDCIHPDIELPRTFEAYGDSEQAVAEEHEARGFKQVTVALLESDVTPETRRAVATQEATDNFSTLSQCMLCNAWILAVLGVLSLCLGWVLLLFAVWVGFAIQLLGLILIAIAQVLWATRLILIRVHRKQSP